MMNNTNLHCDRYVVEIIVDHVLFAIIADCAVYILKVQTVRIDPRSFVVKTTVLLYNMYFCTVCMHFVCTSGYGYFSRAILGSMTCGHGNCLHPCINRSRL